MQQHTRVAETFLQIWHQFSPTLLNICAFFIAIALMQESGMTHVIANVIRVVPLASTIAAWLMLMQALISLHVGLPLSWLLVTQGTSATLTLLFLNRRYSHVLSGLVAKTPSFLRKTRHLMLGFLAYGALIGVNLLYSSFSLVSMGPIDHIDPVIFLCFAMWLLLPVGIFLLLLARDLLTIPVLKNGVQIGTCLSLGLLCFIVALARSGITDATICSCLNGVAATFVAWLLFKQRLSVYTWVACLFAVGGTVLLWWASPDAMQGNFAAFIGGSLITAYAFLLERMLSTRTMRQPAATRAILGASLVTMAVVATGIA
ncbi:MAG: hypothetical protein ACRDHZ_26380, partial [Ktedonobacteraceae bacterium]